MRQRETRSLFTRHKACSPAAEGCGIRIALSSLVSGEPERLATLVHRLEQIFQAEGIGGDHADDQLDHLVRREAVGALPEEERKSAGWGKSESVRVSLGGGR